MMYAGRGLPDGRGAAPGRRHTGRLGDLRQFEGLGVLGEGWQAGPFPVGTPQ